METATQNFLEKGEKIAKESQFLKDELTAAVEDVRKQGIMKTYSFIHRVCGSQHVHTASSDRMGDKSKAMYISSASMKDLEERILYVRRFCHVGAGTQ